MTFNFKNSEGVENMNKYPGIFATPACNEFAEKICSHLDVPLGKFKFEIFSDRERWWKFDENIRGRDVFLISSGADPVETWFDLWLMIDAAVRASAGEITAVVPCYRFGRQDRKDESRVPITASMVAQITQSMGAHRILTMDLHAGATQGSVKIPFDHLYGSDILLDSVLKTDQQIEKGSQNVVAIAVDPGALKMVRPIAERYGWKFAFVDKKRDGHEEVGDESALAIYSDVDIQGNTALIIDDVASTLKSMSQVSNKLNKAGIGRIVAVATHPVLAGPALERLTNSPIETLYIGDTIPLSPTVQKHPKIKVVTMAEIFAEAINGIYRKESVTSLFPGKK